MTKKDNLDLDDLLNRAEEPLREKSELGEVMDSLDRDILDRETSMSSLDMNTRLSGKKIKSILVFDELQRIGIFPKTCSISRQSKRLNISMNGLGRMEKVEIVKGERMNNTNATFGQKFMGLFQKRPE